MPKTPEHILTSVKKYNVSVKGRATRKAYLLAHKEKLLSWNRQHFKKLRILAKLEGKCSHCFKRAVSKGVVCDPCRLRNRENGRKRRLRNAGK